MSNPASTLLSVPGVTAAFPRDDASNLKGGRVPDSMYSSQGGRQSWDEYFLTLASATASRSNCSRRKVGAVVVQQRHIRSTGYNGPPAGYGHCDAGACPRALTESPMSFGYDNCVALHAEANALLFASPQDREGATLYTSAAPCFSCAKLIANSGVTEVVAAGGRYDGWDATRRFLQDCKVRVRLLDGHEQSVTLPLETSDQ